MKTTTRIHHGDIIPLLQGRAWMVQNGFIPKAHAVISDPPYYLGEMTKRFGKEGSAAPKGGVYQRQSRGFMGQSWDGFSDVYEFQAWVTEWATLLLDFVHPGAVGAFFGGTRTYHRVAAGLEDAGWEIFDSILAWQYGSGFPKGHRYDRDFQVARRGTSALSCLSNDAMLNLSLKQRLEYLKLERGWKGWNVSLKPSYEPIILARAPRTGTFAQMAQQYGTGALNIDGARIPGSWSWGTQTDIRGGKYNTARPSEGDVFARDVESNPLGRWPSNTVLVCECGGDHEPGCPVYELDRQSEGTRAEKPSASGGYGETFSSMYAPKTRLTEATYTDSGTASRFFYTAKAAQWEREAGLQSRTARKVNDGRDTPIDNAYQRGETQRLNTHPTVKPIQLINHLATLLLPPTLSEPRRLLVPFSGSGSEMIGAALAGWDDITGFEQSAEYIEIAKQRLAWWGQFKTYEQAERAYKAEHKIAEAESKADPLVKQLELFAAVGR